MLVIGGSAQAAGRWVCEPGRSPNEGNIIYGFGGVTSRFAGDPTFLQFQSQNRRSVYNIVTSPYLERQFRGYMPRKYIFRGMHISYTRFYPIIDRDDTDDPRFSGAYQVICYSEL